MAIMQKRSFSFLKIFCAQTCSQKLEIPISYMESERRLPRKVILRNRLNRVWNIEITETGDGYFFKHGWANFVEENSFINGDQLLFIYDDHCLFNIFIFEPSGCEKIIVQGEKARVMGLKQNDGDVFSVEYDVDILIEVKKDEEIDPAEEKNDGGYYTRSKRTRCIERGSKRAASEMKRDASVKKRKAGVEKKDASVEKRNAGAEEKDSSVEKKDASVEERNAGAEEKDGNVEERNGGAEQKDASVEERNGGAAQRDASVKKKKEVPDHFGLELFRTGRIPQPENPYFVTKVRPKRRDDLYIPVEVLRDHGITLSTIVVLRDPKGKEWRTTVKSWGDGRLWVSGGWKSLCRWNLVEEEDRCICEFVPSLGPEVVLQVTIIRKKDWKEEAPAPPPPPPN